MQSMSVLSMLVSSTIGEDSLAPCQSSLKSTTRRTGTINVTEFISGQIDPSEEPQNESAPKAVPLCRSTRRLVLLYSVTVQHVTRYACSRIEGTSEYFSTCGFLMAVCEDGLSGTWLIIIGVAIATHR